MYRVYLYIIFITNSCFRKSNRVVRLTTLNGSVSFLTRAAWSRFSLPLFAARRLKQPASCFEVFIFALNSGYFRLQLIHHSFKKFRGLRNGSLEHAVHHRRVLRLKIVRRHFDTVSRAPEFHRESSTNAIRQFTVVQGIIFTKMVCAPQLAVALFPATVASVRRTSSEELADRMC